MSDKNDDGGESGLELSREQQGQVEERAPPSAVVVHEVIRREGEDELERAPVALAWSGLAAGLSMGFSMVSEGLLRAHLPDAPWRPLVSKFGYCVGFLIVVMGRQQLFTENTLTPILPLLTNRDGKTLLRVLRLWAIVLATNILGAGIFAWVAGHTDVFPQEIRHAFREIGKESLRGGFGSHLLRGIFAGWMIALMVWLLPAAEQARLHIIVIVTYIVGLAGFSHIIAGSVDTLYLTLLGQVAVSAYWTQFMLPTLLGNILGGTLLVAALNYGQAAPAKDGSQKNDE